MSRHGPHDAAGDVGAVRRNGRAAGHPWFDRTHGSWSRDEAAVDEVIGSEHIPSIPDVKHAVMLAAPECRPERLRAVFLAATLGRLKPLDRPAHCAFQLHHAIAIEEKDDAFLPAREHALRLR